MNPVYIYFKELDIDKDDNFTLNFSKDNEIENVIFDKEYEYAVTGLKINVDLPDEQVIEIENKEKLDQKSNEIHEIIKNYKEPDITFNISNTETTPINITFDKKNETILPLKNTHIITPQVKKLRIFLYMTISKFWIYLER